jgi:hypothetical protein
MNTACCLILCAVVVGAVAGCQGGGSSGSQLYGTWSGIGPSIVPGSRASGRPGAALITLNLREDKTFTLAQQGTSDDGKWSQAGDEFTLTVSQIQGKPSMQYVDDMRKVGGSSNDPQVQQYLNDLTASLSTPVKLKLSGDKKRLNFETGSTYLTKKA